MSHSCHQERDASDPPIEVKQEHVNETQQEHVNDVQQEPPHDVQ